MRMMVVAFEKGAANGLQPEESQLVNQIFDAMAQQLDGLVPQIIDISVRIYADVYTEKELRDLLAFDTSDSGRSIQQKAPLIRQQALALTMPEVINAMPQIVRQTANQVCDRNHCSDRQRAAILTALSKGLQTPPS
jgi:hypothetical protein